MDRRYSPRAVAIGVALALAYAFSANSLQAAGPRLAYVRSPLQNESAASVDLQPSFLAERYRGGLQIMLGHLQDGAGSFTSISSEFHSATDPAFDHAGKRLVFTARRVSTDPFQLWEYFEGQPTQLIFPSSHDCIQPSFLPNGRLVFASNMAGEFEEHGGVSSLSLFEWWPAEEQLVRITHNPSSDFDPEVLPDGRILYSSWQHTGNHFWPTGTTALLIVNSDGTGIFPLTGNHRPPWMKRSARSSMGDEILLLTGPDASLAGGEIQSTYLNDAFAEYVTVPGMEGMATADLAPLSDGSIVVSARMEAAGDLGIHVLENGILKTIQDDPEFDEFAPAVDLPRPDPDIRFSTVVEGTPHGFLLVLDVYDTDRTHQHAFERGEIEFVRVLEGLPATRSEVSPRDFFLRDESSREPWIGPHGVSSAMPTRILGEVPPASDGSIYLKVPADRPLRLQLVDEDGFVRADERAWFWVRPNERRVCIGCHEDRELSPHNQTALAAARRPTDLTEPGGWETVSFLEDVQPILDDSCAFTGCHASPRPAAALVLSGEYSEEPEAAFAPFLVSYLNLMARQAGKPAEVGGRTVHPGDALSSPLLWMLYGRPLAPQYTPAPFDRPMAMAHPGPMLPEAQLSVFRRWVDLGAVYMTPASALLEFGTTARMYSTDEVRP